MAQPHGTTFAHGSQELASLFDEIRRYLEAVDFFRREGHEPFWRPEGPETNVLR